MTAIVDRIWKLHEKMKNHFWHKVGLRVFSFICSILFQSVLLFMPSIVSCQDYDLCIGINVFPLSKHHTDLRICLFYVLMLNNLNDGKLLMSTDQRTDRTTITRERNVQHKGLQGLSKIDDIVSKWYQSGLPSSIISLCCLPGSYLSLILGEVPELKKSSPRPAVVLAWRLHSRHTTYVAGKRSQ